MINALITFVIYALVVGLIVWLVHYVVDALPVGEPFNRFAKVGATVLGVIILLVLLLSIIGAADVGLPRLR